MRNISRPQYVRHRHIIELIRDGMTSGKYANAGTFMRELGISRPTAMRDMDFLRDDEGAPIEYDASRKGYYLTDESWSLPPIRLNRREVFAFSIAGKLLNAYRGTPLELDMGALFEKIGQSLEGSITLNPSTLTDHLTVMGEDYVIQDAAIWTATAEAIDRRERIGIEYQRFDGMVKQYNLEPYHLLSYHGNWYVIGRNIAAERIATFAVSRIREMQSSGLLFAVDPTFDIREFIRDAFGIVRGEKLFKVRLLFSSKVAAYIRERVWHASQSIIEKHDGSIELQFETAGWNELVRWVLSWQPDVKVIAPKRLHSRVREKLLEAVALSSHGALE